jgi:hypothetical protein
MNKVVVTVVVTIVAIGLIFGAGFGVARYWERNQQAPTPAPIPLDKGAIIDALRVEPKLIVAEQDYTIAFQLSNEVRQRMLDTAKNDTTILDKLAISVSKFENLLGGDNIEMIGKGRVVLVVDVMSMTTEDVVQNGNVITITTPPVRVYDVIVDQEASIPTERDSGLWIKLMDNDDLRNQAQAEIRPQIMNEACKTTLMADGQTAARTAIADLLKLVVPPTMTIEVKVDAGSCALPQE